MLVALYFISGLVLLYYGADYLVKGGANIALKLKVSPLVIGLTLVAYGTSAPEFVVSVDAATKGLADVSLGNIVGSNICNIALILGLCSIITPLRVNKKLLKADIGVMYLGEIERGIKMPSMNIFIKLIEALDISADYVLRDELSSGKEYVFDEITKKLDNLTPQQRKTATDILDAYIRNL